MNDDHIEILFFWLNTSASYNIFQNQVSLLWTCNTNFSNYYEIHVRIMCACSFPLQFLILLDWIIFLVDRRVQSSRKKQLPEKSPRNKHTVIASLTYEATYRYKSF